MELQKGDYVLISRHYWNKNLEETLAQVKRIGKRDISLDGFRGVLRRNKEGGYYVHDYPSGVKVEILPKDANIQAIKDRIAARKQAEKEAQVEKERKRAEAHLEGYYDLQKYIANGEVKVLDGSYLNWNNKIKAVWDWHKSDYRLQLSGTYIATGGKYAPSWSTVTCAAELKDNPDFETLKKQVMGEFWLYVKDRGLAEIRTKRELDEKVEALQ